VNKLFFLLSFIFFQSCFVHENKIVEQRDLFKEIKDQEFKFLNQEVLDKSTRVAASSLISEVSVDSNLVKKSFEQILVFSKSDFKFAWYAPNYLQILSTLVGDEKSWIFCDYIGRFCFNDFSQSDEFSFLDSFLNINGFSIPGLFLGIATNYKNSENFHLTAGPDSQYILSYKKDDLIFEFLLNGENKSKMVTEKLFISNVDGRILEIFYDYDQSKGNIQVPLEVELRLIEENLSFKFKLKKFNQTNITNQSNSFNLEVPQGFNSK